MKKIALKTIDSQEYETPQKLFDELNKEYHFTLDPCATKENAKCSRYFTKEDDGLEQRWEGNVFVNPPFRDIAKWVKKGYEEAQKHARIVVMLLPARTDTRWFHDYCTKGKIEFIKGRLKFGGSKNSAPFPSMIVFFEDKIPVEFR